MQQQGCSDIPFFTNTLAEEFALVDTKESLSALLDSLNGLALNPPSLYFDAEGIDLSRTGSLSLMQLLVMPVNRVYLIDIQTLKHSAFSTTSSDGSTTLKSLLESYFIPKVFFDVRKDSEALYWQYGIRLAGVHDVQLMEAATRRKNRQFIHSLSKCIESNSGLAKAEIDAWAKTKMAGKKSFRPEHSGTYEVFSQRPLSKAIGDYCAQDVKFLPRLWSAYCEKLTSSEWKERVRQATFDRIKASQDESELSKDRSWTLVPPGWSNKQQEALISEQKEINKTA